MSVVAAGVAVQHLLPRNWLSRTVYRIARSEARWIKRSVDPLVRSHLCRGPCGGGEPPIDALIRRSMPSLRAPCGRRTADRGRPEHRRLARRRHVERVRHGHGRTACSRPRACTTSLAALLGESRPTPSTHFTRTAFLHRLPRSAELPPRARCRSPERSTRTTYIPGERFSVSLVATSARSTVCFAAMSAWSAGSKPIVGAMVDRARWAHSTCRASARCGTARSRAARRSAGARASPVPHRARRRDRPLQPRLDRDRAVSRGRGPLDSTGSFRRRVDQDGSGPSGAWRRRPGS